MINLVSIFFHTQIPIFCGFIVKCVSSLPIPQQLAKMLIQCLFALTLKPEIVGISPCEFIVIDHSISNHSYCFLHYSARSSIIDKDVKTLN